MILLGITGIIFAEEFKEGIQIYEGKNTINLSFEFAPFYVEDLIKFYPEISTITYNENEKEIGYVNVFGGIGENFVVYPNKIYEITTSREVDFKFKMKKTFPLEYNCNIFNFTFLLCSTLYCRICRKCIRWNKFKWTFNCIMESR